MTRLINSLYDKNHENSSPLTCRRYGLEEPYDCVNNLNTKVFKYLFDDNTNNPKMVIAHTPQFIFGKNINSICDNKIIRLDVGMSKGFEEHYLLVKELILKQGLKFLSDFQQTMTTSKNRYISIIKIENDVEQIITEKKFSRNLNFDNNVKKSEAFFNKENIKKLINDLENINFQDKQQIIESLNLIINKIGNES
jgi:hypothetical protein